MARCYPIFSDEDADLRDLYWGLTKGRYARREVSGNSVFAHKVVVERKYGRRRNPMEYCDHMNRNTLDNRRENLCLVTPLQNSQNLGLSPKNTSGFRGVSWCKKCCKWRAAVKYKHKYYDLGFFMLAEEAGAAAEAKRTELGFYLGTHETRGSA